jgi:hypothetical protein
VVALRVTCTRYLKIYPGSLAVNFATLKVVLYSTVDGTPVFKIGIFQRKRQKILVGSIFNVRWGCMQIAECQFLHKHRKERRMTESGSVGWHNHRGKRP